MIEENVFFSFVFKNKLGNLYQEIYSKDSYAFILQLDLPKIHFILKQGDKVSMHLVDVLLLKRPAFQMKMASSNLASIPEIYMYILHAI